MAHGTWTPGARPPLRPTWRTRGWSMRSCRSRRPPRPAVNSFLLRLFFSLSLSPALGVSPRRRTFRNRADIFLGGAAGESIRAAGWQRSAHRQMKNRRGISSGRGDATARVSKAIWRRWKRRERSRIEHGRAADVTSQVGGAWCATTTTTAASGVFVGPGGRSASAGRKNDASRREPLRSSAAFDSSEATAPVDRCASPDL